ncbi:MAG: hypothetical protein AAGJ56_06060 [Myxococcota bacterium]
MASFGALLFVACGDELSDPELQLEAVEPDTAAAVGDDGIRCLTEGQTYTASYTTETGQTRSFSLKAGENWGRHPVTGNNYDCMGHCGGSCPTGAIGPRYTQDCLEHDVCSWLYASTRGSADLDCGDEFDDGANDVLGDKSSCPEGGGSRSSRGIPGNPPSHVCGTLSYEVVTHRQQGFERIQNSPVCVGYDIVTKQRPESQWALEKVARFINSSGQQQETTLCYTNSPGRAQSGDNFCDIRGDRIQ